MNVLKKDKWLRVDRTIFSSHNKIIHTLQFHGNKNFVICSSTIIKACYGQFHDNKN